MRAPTITPTGCPVCGQRGIPGTACHRCIEVAHAHAVRSAQRAYFAADQTATVAAQLGDIRAAWVGANVLLDGLGALLVVVGFELPEVPS